MVCIGLEEELLCGLYDWFRGRTFTDWFRGRTSVCFVWFVLLLLIGLEEGLLCGLYYFY